MRRVTFGLLMFLWLTIHPPMVLATGTSSCSSTISPIVKMKNRGLTTEDRMKIEALGSVKVPDYYGVNTGSKFLLNLREELMKIAEAGENEKLILFLRLGAMIKLLTIHSTIKDDLIHRSDTERYLPLDILQSMNFSKSYFDTQSVESNKHEAIFALTVRSILEDLDAAPTIRYALAKGFLDNAGNHFFKPNEAMVETLMAAIKTILSTNIEDPTRRVALNYISYFFKKATPKAQAEVESALLAALLDFQDPIRNVYWQQYVQYPISNQFGKTVLYRVLDLQLNSEILSVRTDAIEKIALLAGTSNKTSVSYNKWILAQLLMAIFRNPHEVTPSELILALGAYKNVIYELNHFEDAYLRLLWKGALSPHKEVSLTALRLLAEKKWVGTHARVALPLDEGSEVATLWPIMIKEFEAKRWVDRRATILNDLKKQILR